MARKTKAEKLAEQQAREMEREEQDRQAYPARLMQLLERADKYDFSLRVVDGLFKVTVPDSLQEFMFSIQFQGWSSTNELNWLEYELNGIQRFREEEAARAAAKQAAMNKLTKEERELLGL